MTEKLLVPDIGDFENVEVIELLVKEGQEIGFVSNNNIIHFEIWGNNQKLNPTKWIKNGYK